jgi:hypothetical protein
MKLFSKRNKNLLFEQSGFRIRPHFTRKSFELISQEVRNRIVSEIRFLTSSDDYVEFFVLFDDQKEERKYFDKNKIDHFSLSELGYRMSFYFDFEDFAIIQQIKDNSEDQRDKFEYFDDYKLFDLAEMVILFSKKEKRSEVIDRFNAILLEENSNYQIIENLITRKEGETMKTLVTLLKDEKLKQKINSFYELLGEEEYTNSAKISADIVNIIFSGFLKDDKPEIIKVITEKIAKKIVTGTSNKKGKCKQFVGYLDELLRCSRDLNNNIYDVRHTEKSTVEISNENIFKLISSLNLSMVELVLTSLKDDFILGEDWEKIKVSYINKYNIDRKTRLAIKKPEQIKNPGEIDIEEIPF